MDNENRLKRRYTLRKRADEMAETRRRITVAAVELHGTVGPARTTMSAVAERAGVQRHTLYRHFPDEVALLGACSAHFLAENPWPDLKAWRTIADPRRRLMRALDELYAYYERTQPMFSNILRDIELVEALGPTTAPMQGFLAEAGEILTSGWPTTGRRRRVLTAAVNHAIDFRMWRSLVAGDRITRTEAVELVTALVEAAASPPRATATPTEAAAGGA